MFLGGGFKCCLFSPRSLGRSNLTSIFFFNGMKPPTSFLLVIFFLSGNGCFSFCGGNFRVMKSMVIIPLYPRVTKRWCEGSDLEGTLPTGCLSTWGNPQMFFSCC